MQSIASLNDGPALSDLAILTVAALVFYGLAVVSFDRRDVTAGAWPWVRWAGR